MMGILSSLETEILRVAQMINSITTNWAVFRMDGTTLQEIDRRASGGDAVLVQMRGELLAKIISITKPTDYTAIAQAYEIFEEAFIYITLSDKQLPLSRTPGTGGHAQKRPDFQCDHALGRFFVEVKTLDFQDGPLRHDDIANNALDAKANLEIKSRRPGVHVGEPVSISSHRPGSTATDRIETAIKKIRGNLKREQIIYGPTVLVVDLTRLLLDGSHPSALLPSYYHSTSQACVSGELWHVGFGQPNDLILVPPEFEGATNIDRRLQQTGILLEYPELMGLAFVCRSFQGGPKILTPRKVTPDFSEVTGPLGEH
jgi:hypothetical protein